MSIRNAWEAFDSGDLTAALTLFEASYNSDSEAAMIGMAQVSLARGDDAGALAIAEQALEEFQSSEVVALYGECIGQLGRRKEAEDWLLTALESDPRNGHARTLLGEQRIRRGRWEEGAKDIVAGLANDLDGRAFRHVKRVITDLVDAVIANKVREPDAVKFVNLIDYNLASKTPEMAAFFGAVRRAIASGRSVSEKASRPRSGGSGPPRSQAIARSEPSSNSRAPGASAPAQLDPPARKTARQNAVNTERRTAIRRPMGNEPVLLELIRRDRRLNEELQSDIEPLGLPIWPSNQVALDQSVALRPELLNISSDELKKSKLHVTTGSIRSEILLIRALDILRRGASEVASRPLEYTLSGITQLEVLCWDGLLQRLPPMPETYRENVEFVQAELTLGAFIGACITTACSDATWKFREPVNQSTISVGNTVAQPFATARAWIQAADKDEVELATPVLDALAAAEEKFMLERAHIDATRDLTDTALQLRLAELWTTTRSRGETTLTEVAEAITPREVTSRIIIFGLHYSHAPPIARGPQNAAMISSTEVPIAYLRATGEFLLLASRKHFSRALGAAVDELSSESAKEVLRLLASYHRPHWMVGRNNGLPRMERRKHGAMLVFELHAPEGPMQMDLEHTPGTVIPWRLTEG